MDKPEAELYRLHGRLPAYRRRLEEAAGIVRAAIDGHPGEWCACVSGGKDSAMALHWRPLPVEYADAQGIEGDLMDWGIRPPARIAANITACRMPISPAP